MIFIRNKMVSNVAEAESMSKSEQRGWEQTFFEDYAALFVFLLTYFFGTF